MDDDDCIDDIEGHPQEMIHDPQENNGHNNNNNDDGGDEINIEEIVVGSNSISDVDWLVC